jgi:hypothetical protein
VSQTPLSLPPSSCGSSHTFACVNVDRDRATASWKTVLVALILIVLLAAARIGDAEALAHG